MKRKKKVKKQKKRKKKVKKEEGKVRATHGFAFQLQPRLHPPSFHVALQTKTILIKQILL